MISARSTLARAALLATTMAAGFAVLPFTTEVLKAAAGVSFSGRAVGAMVSSKALDGTITLKAKLSDTGSLPNSGGVKTASLLKASIPNVLTAGVVQAATVGQGDRTRSEASIANANVTFAGLTITASLIASQAEAVCTQSGPTVSGDSQLLALKINNESITVTGAPNQTIFRVGAGGVSVKLVINEQIVDDNQITVNALHLSIASGVIADVILAHSRAGVGCLGAPTCTKNQDFVTGFGFFDASGARADFAFSAGIKPNGALAGHLSFARAGGPTVSGQCVYSYEILNEVTRRFGMTACIGNACGFTALVTVEDNANPDGTGADRFTIALSNGQTFTGLLQGGNIQIHEPCK